MILRTLLHLGLNDCMNKLRIRRKPRVIQMPITSRCNSRCVTCNVWKEPSKIDIDSTYLRKILLSSYFSEVRLVGINGGELTLSPNFFETLDAVLVLPKIRTIHLISNGLLPERLLSILERAKKKCDEKGVCLGFTLSVDGVGKTHELVRGVPKCFKRTKLILDEFKKEPHKYFSYGYIGCTLSRYNISYVREMELFFKNYPLSVEWHLAVPNKRIHTFNDFKDYYILEDDESRLLAIEFFYEKMNKAKGLNKFRWFAQYYFLLNKGKGRLAQCEYRYRDVTIDENLYLYLCATASEKISDLNNIDTEQIKGMKSFDIEAKNIGKYCDKCTHYINNNPTIKGLWLFCKYILCEKIKRNYKFQILTKWRI